MPQADGHTWLETWAGRISKWLGSLQVAVLLLLLFAVFALPLGTMMESWYSAAVAQELVYRSWWFTLLLCLLSVNIFFAALKKWPWKKYQTGFLITHLGLLTMLAGGIWTSLSGVDATMVLIDTSNPAVTENPTVLSAIGSLRQSSKTIGYPDEGLLTISELKLDSQQRPVVHKSITKLIDPGAFPWKTEPDEFDKLRREQRARSADSHVLLLDFLAWLAHPLPRSWQSDLWDGSSIKVLAFYPHCKEKDRTEFVPDFEMPPGMQREGFTPALRCRITNGRESRDFWVGQNRTNHFGVGDKFFKIEYRTHTEELPFELKLLRAEQTNDKGTQSAASYTSWVQLTDKDQGISGEDRMITMNEPLNHRGFKVYQSNYGSITQSLGITDPSSGRPISYSGFTVGRDPGLWLKYLGSSMLALGIACMFYMKAYFFKPRGRTTPTNTPGGPLTEGAPAEGG